MTNKFIVFVVLIMCAAALGVAYITSDMLSQTPVAQAEALPEKLAEQPSLAESLPPAARSHSSVSAADQFSAATNLLGESFAATHPVLNVARDLIRPYQQTMLQPGWVHVVLTEEHPDAQFMAENEVQSPTATNEFWYFMGADELVREGVAYHHDENGNLTVISVYRDGRIYYPLTDNFFEGDVPALRLPLDGDFLAALQTASDNGDLLEQSTSVLNDTAVQVFSSSTNFDAREVNGLAQPAQGFRHTAYVDAQSGMVYQVERVFLSPNGNEQVWLRLRYLVVERVENPPSEVLAYLENMP